MRVNLLKHSLYFLKLNFEGYNVMLLQQFELHNGLTIIMAELVHGMIYTPVLVQHGGKCLRTENH